MTHRLKLGVLAPLALAGLTLAAPALAQDGETEDEIGSRFNREKYDGQRGARETMSYFGRCVAEYKSDEIKAFLVNPTYENWEPILDFPNSQTHCAIRNLAAGFQDHLGALSEGWYLHEYADAPPAYFATAENKAPPQEEVAAAIIAADEEERPQVVIDEFARCVAAVNPVGVDALLRTEHGDEDETAAIQALLPSFAPCAFEGQKLGFDRAGLRSALAYALATRAVLEIPG